MALDEAGMAAAAVEIAVWDKAVHGMVRLKVFTSESYVFDDDWNSTWEGQAIKDCSVASLA